MGLIGADMGPLLLPQRHLMGPKCFPRGKWRGFGLYLMVSGFFEEILLPSSPSQPSDEGSEWARPTRPALLWKQLQHRGCCKPRRAQPSHRANEFPYLLPTLITFCNSGKESFPTGASWPDLLPGPQLVSSLCLRWILTAVGHGHGCKPGGRCRAPGPTAKAGR